MSVREGTVELTCLGREHSLLERESFASQRLEPTKFLRGRGGGRAG